MPNAARIIHQGLKAVLIAEKKAILAVTAQSQKKNVPNLDRKTALIAMKKATLVVIVPILVKKEDNSITMLTKVIQIQKEIQRIEIFLVQKGVLIVEKKAILDVTALNLKKNEAIIMISKSLLVALIVGTMDI